MAFTMEERKPFWDDESFRCEMRTSPHHCASFPSFGLFRPPIWSFFAYKGDIRILMIVHRALILCVLWTATQGQQIPHAICTETVVAPVNEGGVDLLNGSPDAGDDLTLSMTPQADAVFGNPGVHADEVKLTVTDSGGLHDTCTVPMVVVYENAGNGFVTGGGWIDSPGGAYQLDPDLTGKAHFGFNSKYQKRASVSPFVVVSERIHQFRILTIPCVCPCFRYFVGSNGRNRI